VRWKAHQVAIFDCDSTLATIEGIDELCQDPKARQEIADLTDAAMAGEIPLEEVYGRRLEILHPTKAEIQQLTAAYQASAVPDAREVLEALHSFDVESWVVSGGLLEPVAAFSEWLGVPSDRIRAVGATYDPLVGNWWKPGAQPRYADHDGGELTTTSGKADVIRRSVKNPGRKLMIGDGVSDLAAAEAVDLFVGYSGVVARPNVVDEAPVVVQSTSLAPVLALILGPALVRELVDGPHDKVARTCLDAVDDGALRFNDTALAQRFDAGFSVG
jgi:phosphoserine phosphatase